MTDLIAKPVLKNKYWIVESDGSKIGTIQATDDGGVVYVHNQSREKFNSIKLLKQIYNVKFDKPSNKQRNNLDILNNFPIEGKAFNVLWDIKNKCPVYTKSAKSKSYFCAGYFVIKNETWNVALCPKLITVNRYKYIGPFQSKQDVDSLVDKLNGK